MTFPPWLETSPGQARTTNLLPAITVLEDPTRDAPHAHMSPITAQGMPPMRTVGTLGPRTGVGPWGVPLGQGMGQT